MSAIGKLIAYLRREPALVLTAAAEGISLGAAFGLKLNPEQTKAIYGFVAAVAGVLIRSQVTPNVSLSDVLDSKIEDIKAAVLAAGTVAPQPPAATPSVVPLAQPAPTGINGER